MADLSHGPLRQSSGSLITIVTVSVIPIDSLPGSSSSVSVGGAVVDVALDAVVVVWCTSVVEGAVAGACVVVEGPGDAEHDAVVRATTMATNDPILRDARTESAGGEREFDAHLYRLTRRHDVLRPVAIADRLRAEQP